MGSPNEALQRLKELEEERRALLTEASDAIKDVVEAGVREVLEDIDADYIGVSALRRGDEVTVKVRTQPRRRNAYDPEDAYQAIADGTLKDFAEEVGIDPRSAQMAAKRWAEANEVAWPPSD